MSNNLTYICVIIQRKVIFKMITNNKKHQISVSEISKTLQWPYTTVRSIIDRKSPTEKYDTILKCIIKLENLKKNLQAEFNNN